jgi:hypothetical protein
MLQVSIYRYNPEVDHEPHMQDFEVETGGKDLMVLDVLEMIKAQMDPSVTYRRLPRGCLRFRRFEHQRQKRPGLHYAAVRSGQEATSW